IQRPRRVALLRGLLEHARVPENVAEREMSVGTLRTPPHQIRRRIVSAAQLSTLYPVCDQVARRHYAIGIERNRSFIRCIRPLEHFLAATAVRRVVVISQSQGFPGWCVAGVDSNR